MAAAALIALALLGCLHAPMDAAHSGQCRLAHGHDCQHGDLRKGPIETAEECCGWCAQTPGCTAFTHAKGIGQYKGAMCYLKKNCSQMVANDACTAGLVARSERASMPAPAPHPSVVDTAVDGSELLHSVNCIDADLDDGSGTPCESLRECSASCARTAGCSAFTYKRNPHGYDGALCYLKTDCITVSKDPDCTSGIMISPVMLAPSPGGAPADLLTPQSQGSAPQSQGSASLVQTARDTGDRLTVKRDVSFVPDFSTSGPTVDVSSVETDQVIVGFGGAFTEASALVFAGMDSDLQQDFLEKYFDPDNGIGYSLGRVPINSCDFSPNPASWSEDDVEGDYALLHFDTTLRHDARAIIPFIKAAMEKIRLGGRELKLFASPWSPPAWMKTTGKMVGGGKLRTECFASWAAYFVKWIEAYKAQGIPIWAVTPQNEPMNPAAWEACLYTPEEEAHWIGSHLGPALQMAHPEVLVLPFDHNKDAVYTWARTMYNHPAASSYTSGIAFHWYSGDSFDNVARVHKEFPQALLLPSEATWEKAHWGPGTTPASGDWSFGEGYAHDIIGDLNAGAAGWTDWNLLLDTQGGPNHLGNYCDAPMMADAEEKRLYVHPQYYYVGHFSKYIPPGSKRIQSSVTGSNSYGGPIRAYGSCGGEDGLEATAFQLPDGRVAVVVLNCGDEAVDFKLKDGDRAVRASIPAHSIQTYVFQRLGGWYV